MAERLRLQLDDDRRSIDTDMPPRRVRAALMRSRAALQRGQAPADTDVVVVMRYVREQEAKYDGIQDD